MLDITNIVTNSEYYKVFYNNGTGGTGGGQPSTGSWQTWTKPRGKCDFIWIMCMSGGAGGSGGGLTATGNGGASAAITTAVFPAHVLPDTLFIWVGRGGTGGAGNATTGVAGVTGGKSLVALKPVTSSIYASPGNMDLVCASGQSAWTIVTSAENGNDSTTWLPRLISLGTWNSVDGRAQAAGNVTPLSGSTITCPGANGATTSATTGSSILSINLGNFSTPTIAGGLSEGGKGADGIWSWSPMYGLGGAGGGGGGAGTVGGRGGNGAYGCGGGGGGIAANVGGNVGGNGGDGGDGLVIIATF
jgi:hypothetical protein